MHDDAAERLRRGPKLDPAGPDFWDVRFREGYTPWDAGGVPAALREFLVREPAGRRVLIPGCGSGYEVRAFAAAGHEVVAIDFSPAAIAAARGVLGELGHLVVQGDFFAHPFGLFDLVYERPFLCAHRRCRALPIGGLEDASLFRRQSLARSWRSSDSGERTSVRCSREQFTNH